MSTFHDYQHILVVQVLAVPMTRQRLSTPCPHMLSKLHTKVGGHTIPKAAASQPTSIAPSGLHSKLRIIYTPLHSPSSAFQDPASPCACRSLPARPHPAGAGPVARSSPDDTPRPPDSPSYHSVSLPARLHPHPRPHRSHGSPSICHVPALPPPTHSIPLLFTPPSVPPPPPAAPAAPHAVEAEPAGRGDVATV